MDDSTITFLQKFALAMYDTAIDNANQAESIVKSGNLSESLYNRKVLEANLCCHIADAIKKALQP